LFLILRDEYRLKVFQNRVLERIEEFEAEKEDEKKGRGDEYEDRKSQQ
jgi:hypothetical protein